MDAVATLRRFNRSYTQRVGALDESFLGTGRPLGESRLLLEIGADGVAVRTLRDRLGLDSGYLARLLRRLEDAGLSATAPDPDDGRRRLAVLTDAGRAALADLEQRSEAAAHRILDPLTPRQRSRLADALATADLLVRAATVTLREVDDEDDADVRSALDAYLAEIAARFGYDPARAEPTAADRAAGEHGPTRYVVVASEGHPVAVGGLRALSGARAEVKRMWVDPAWRGAGLGARLLAHLEGLATARGHTELVLDTNSSLTEAVALYERAGYEPVERYNDNPYAEAFYAKPLTPRG